MSSGAEIKTYNFSDTRVATLIEERELDWPVVYQIYDDKRLYIGETTSLKSRMLQHLSSVDKAGLERFSVIFDEKYNKSVALDLEAQLIQWFGGDGQYTMLNRNDGIASHRYYNRDHYQRQFEDIWEQLRGFGIAKGTKTDIENSGLFKFSPYKQLNEDQLRVVHNVLEALDEALKEGSNTISVIGGKEGTGKTIVIMYLAKLIRDIQDYSKDDDVDSEQDLSLFFTKPFRSRFKNQKIAVVIPNQSLKGSISKIFKSINNLSGGRVEVLSPIEFGRNGKMYDITLVDEAHLLKRSGWSQTSAVVAKNINATLLGDGLGTELDWIVKKSKNVVMVYGDQRVRQIHITQDDINAAAIIGGHQVRDYLLNTQMRSRGGEPYIEYLQEILSDSPPAYRRNFDGFEFKLYDDFTKFVNDIRNKDQEVGLSRLVAGFAWNWESKWGGSAYDIVIDGVKLRWNSKLSDWVGSAQSSEEVGSIYTIQGFDLNYCGVIIGKDLRYDPVNKKLIISKQDYFDDGARNRSRQQIDAGEKLTDEELLEQIVRTYRILMNRSVKGTYVYACDENLREYLSRYIPPVVD